MAARVVGQRGHARAPAPRARSRSAISFADPAPWQITTPARGASSGTNSAYARPSWVPSSGRGGTGCFIIAHAIMSRRLEQQAAPAGTGVSHVYPDRVAPERARGAWRSAAATCSTSPREFGTPAYVYAGRRHPLRAPARTSTASASAPTASRWSTPARRSRARRPTGCWPRRASPATSRRAASCTWRCAAASRPRRSTSTATTSRARRSSYAQRGGRRPHRHRLVPRDRA